MVFVTAPPRPAPTMILPLLSRWPLPRALVCLPDGKFHVDDEKDPCR